MAREGLDINLNEQPQAGGNDFFRRGVQAFGAGVANAALPGLGLGLTALNSFSPGNEGPAPPVFGDHFGNGGGGGGGFGAGGLAGLLPVGVQPTSDRIGAILANAGVPGFREGLQNATLNVPGGDADSAVDNFLRNFRPGQTAAGIPAAAPVVDDFDERFATALSGAQGRFGQRATDVGLGSLLSPPLPDATTAPVGDATLLDGTTVPLPSPEPSLTPLEQRFAREAEFLGTQTPRTTTNLDALFDPGFFDQVIENERLAQQAQASNAFNEFATPGFANSLVPTTSDDAILDSILQDQFGSANLQIDRALARGNLSDVGATSAREGLTGQRSAASSELSSIGDAILGTNRNALTGIANEGRDALANFSLANPFDPSQFSSRIDTAVGEQQGRLEGDIRSAIGGQQFFDIPSLINRGAQAQGLINPRGQLLDALSQREEERSKTRGLGSSGVF